MNRVMIVEDESLVALELSESLRAHGCEVVGISSDAQSALALAKESQPNLVLMDIRIKGEIDGIALAKELLAQQEQLLLIFLTAFSDERHIKEAIALQPLGYLVKPIRTAELYALLELANLQQKDILQGDIILDAHFSIDSQTTQLIKDGEYISLTKRERQLLALLLRHKNAIVSIYEMELAIWPNSAPSDSRRRSLVNRLRSKLDNRFIQTLHAQGYRLSF